jgi:ribose transport system substrate-binding protein
VTLKQHPNLCAVVGVWDIPDLGTAAAIAQAGKTGKVFLSTNGGFSDYACKAIKEDKFNNYISFNVPGQGRDVNNLIQMALQSDQKPGTLKVALYSPLRDISKADVEQGGCWSLDTVHE